MSWLSPKALNEYLECPRCFWISRNKKLKCPFIMATLMEGIDNRLKDYMDLIRNSNAFAIPGETKIYLYKNQEQLNKWRDWKEGLRLKLGNNFFSGALDDLLINNKKQYIPLDFKTKGQIPSDGYAEKWYNVQLSSYEWMLQRLGFKTAGFAYAAFFSPSLACNMKKDMTGIDFFFNITFQKVKTNVLYINNLYKDAANCLTKKIPKGNCKLCQYIEERNTIE